MRRTRIAIVLAVAVIAVGLVMVVLGFYFLNLCTWSYAGLCIRRDYADRGLLVALVGVAVSAIVPFWLLSTSRVPAHAGAELYCTACGDRLRWVRESDQWYCDRCGQYRFPLSEQQPHHDV